MTMITDEELFNHLRVLEAVLFTATTTVTEKELEAFFEPQTDISLLLEHLQQHYQNRGVQLVKRGNGWAMRTAPDLAERLEVRKVEIKPMSRAAIETLAIIAYHQPVTRAEIEQVRGVSISKSTFELLVAENLIKPGKRRDIPGRPLTWITTQHFLDAFSLESIKELPNLMELKEAGLLSMQPPVLADKLQPSLPTLETLDEQEDRHEQDEVAAEQENEFELAFAALDTQHTGEAA